MFTSNELDLITIVVGNRADDVRRHNIGERDSEVRIANEQYAADLQALADKAFELAREQEVTP